MDGKYFFIQIFITFSFFMDQDSFWNEIRFFTKKVFQKLLCFGYSKIILELRKLFHRMVLEKITLEKGVLLKAIHFKKT